MQYLSRVSDELHKYVISKLSKLSIFMPEKTDYLNWSWLEPGKGYGHTVASLGQVIIDFIML